ncbi:acetate--CoA ligase family protein [Antarctobacter sp.]|uniref:acetate--CoA ligase family protein n=1 Tax=Antarctobacter sp. TaxID=1872577 RepID=UPI002B26C6E6|nr:acetate--CoA ligase family protein [Antarctobacter sp.]
MTIQDTSAVNALFNPRTVAIVGASPRAGSAGNTVLRNLIDSGYAGEIYPVNPRYDEIEGRASYSSLSEIGRPVETVFIAVAARFCVDILQEAAALGVRAVCLNATGFAEDGEKGRARQAEIARIAAEHDMAICGPNNLGLINVVDHVTLWSAHLADAQAGPVAVISQSGSVALALTDDPGRLGLSHVVTAGNEAVCGVADYVAHLAADERVKVVLLFLETIRDPEALATAVGRARAAGQRILAVKVGRSEMARAAVEAHSGALSGEDAVVDGFFLRHGIQRCVDIDDMIQRAALCLKTPPTPGSLAAYITLSGGQAAAIADFASDVGLTVSGLPASLAEALKAEFFDRMPENPMDVWGLGWDSERFGRIMEQLVTAPEIDPIVFTLDTPAGGGVDGPMAVDMARVASRYAGRKTILFVSNSAVSGRNEELAEICAANGFPLLLGLPGALRAMAHWGGATADARPAPAANPARLDRQRVEAALNSRLRFVAPQTISSVDDAVGFAKSIDGAVVLKGISPKALHKTELGLVRLGLTDPADIAEAYQAIRSILDEQSASLGEGVIHIEPMIAPGIEVLVAARRDPQFGPLVVFGAGGQLVELLADSTLRLCPIDDAEAGQMIAETRIATLLDGFRGAAPWDLATVRAALCAVAEIMADAGPEVTAIEINPLIVHPDGQGATAVDLVIE